MSPFVRNAVISFLLLPIFLFIGWILSGTGLSDEDFQNRISKKETKTVTLGWDRRSGNLLLVQLEFKPEYFTREDRLRAWLEEPLLLAKEKGWLQKTTIVAYPPEIGNYFFLIDSRKEILDADKEHSAWNMAVFFQRILPTNLASFSIGEDTSTFQIADSSKERYQRIFSTLSKIYGVQILAGSICLPSPEVKEGKLLIRPGNWEERAYIFDSEGKFAEGSLLRTRSRDMEIEKNSQTNPNEIPPNIWVANLSFGRIGVVFTEDLKSPALDEMVKKTYISKWIGLGSVEDEGKFREWIKNSSFESSGQVQFSGKTWDYEFPGKSFAKTRYGSPEPLEGQKGNLLINIFF
ncbi:hypothetical protein EHO59_02635 [Leptospira semungkisensis]|uniref:Uncharacterized protein n=1 Tax=Leptospira semungkisensis TaxID=2484985 RepID=A0A4R9G7M8_9LEPT|nr:hypothetical protein [Leptospira semungkisensis]TGK07030.1 hypothetical protein EHO59_02635 [Leptospira semungkisensis]